MVEWSERTGKIPLLNGVINFLFEWHTYFYAMFVYRRFGNFLPFSLPHSSPTFSSLFVRDRTQLSEKDCVARILCSRSSSSSNATHTYANNTFYVLVAEQECLQLRHCESHLRFSKRKTFCLCLVVTSEWRRRIKNPLFGACVPTIIVQPRHFHASDLPFGGFGRERGTDAQLLNWLCASTLNTNRNDFFSFPFLVFGSAIPFTDAAADAVRFKCETNKTM